MEAMSQLKKYESKPYRPLISLNLLGVHFFVRRED